MVAIFKAGSRAWWQFLTLGQEQAEVHSLNIGAHATGWEMERQKEMHAVRWETGVNTVGSLLPLLAFAASLVKSSAGNYVGSLLPLSVCLPSQSICRQ